MTGLLAPIDGIQGFLDSGGPVLWVILVLSIVLWCLILERYWYLYRVHPASMRELITLFDRIGSPQKHKLLIREAMISRAHLDLTRTLPLIRTLIMLCPLLGLLGTVTGMVHVFDVVAITGTGNAKAMAAGISLATIPTMAGLVTALSGFYFSMRLRQHANREKMLAYDLINLPGGTTHAA